MTADAEQRVAPHAEQPERPFPGSSETARRLEGLRMAAESARGRLDADLIDEAQAVVVRSQTRLGLSGEHTIVALAGATGSGKSSLFNALCGLDLAAVGVKRPTTSWALACAWGPSGAVEILDWLGIPPRHQVSRVSLLDESAADRDLQGLVLLDLPDHDSTEVSHHLEVERLVELADVMVWVLDPQKYADAVIHDRYLRPLSSHRDVMLVVLNQVDQIPPGMVGACLTDVQRLLEIDGLGGVEVITTSATANGGVVGLRESLLAHVSEKRVARQRVEADIAAVAARLAEQTGDAEPPQISEEIHDRLVRACLNSADVPVLVSALEYARLIRARSSTAWPATAWLSRFRADPMSRLPAEDRAPAEAVPAEAVPAEAVPAEAVPTEAVPSEPPRPRRCDLDEASIEAAHTATTEVVPAAPMQRVQVDAAIRDAVEELTEGMPSPWRRSVREAATAQLDEFSRELETAASARGLHSSQGGGGWGFVKAAQWLLFLLALVGGGWLLLALGSDLFGYPNRSNPEVAGLSIPLLMLMCGAGLGLLIAIAGRAVAGALARHEAAGLAASLTEVVEQSAENFVVAPIKAEIGALARTREGLQTALSR